MKKVLTLAVALLAFGASTCLAQGLDMHWNDCSGGAFTNTTPALNCNSNGGVALTLVCSVTPGTAIGQFAAATAVVDIMVGAPGSSLPLWWQTASGQCRANAISMSFDPNNSSGACDNVWGGNPNLQVTAIQQGLHGSNSIRVNGVAALPAGSEIPIGAGAELYLCNVKITKGNTLTCAGCTTPAQVVFNECKMQSPSAPDQVVSNEGGKYCQSVAGGICPGGTPAQNKTWGSVKSLYR
jgi:hypothetical protein